MTGLFFLLDAALTGALCSWMVVAVADNWRHPAMNRDALAMVLRLDLLAKEYPDVFAQLAHRRVEDERSIAAIFALVRWFETLAALMLLAATLALLTAAAGLVAGGAATAAAVTATLLFILIWSGFIIGGNYFCYWYCHGWAQANHFFLMIWGLLVLIVLLN